MAKMRLNNDTSPSGGANLIVLAAEKLREGRPKDAASMLRRVVKTTPQSADAQLLYGVALLKLGKPLKAMGHLETAAKIAPGSAEVFCQLGMALRQLGRSDPAANAFTHALSLDPSHAGAYRELGSLSAESDMLDQAAECFEIAHQLDPSDAEAAFNRGIIENSRGNSGKALEWYCRALEANPRHAGAHINRGNIAQNHRKFELAAKSYRQAAAIEPDNAIPHANLSRALRESGDIEGAIAAAQHAIKLNPNLADGHNNLGNGLKEKGELSESLTCFKRALRLRPKEASIHYNLADALHQLHDYPKARESYSRALELNPKMAVAWNNIGLVHAELGDMHEATSCFGKAHDLEPTHDGYACSYSQSMETLAFRIEDWDLLKKSIALSDACFRCGLRTPNREFSIPRWDPFNDLSYKRQLTNLSDKRLLIWREQGIGDEIRFARSVQHYASLAKHVILESDPRLVGVMQRSFPNISVVPMQASETLMDFKPDMHMPAGDMRKIKPKSFEAPPWLTVDPELEGKWEQRLSVLPGGLKIGICWRSGLTGRLRNPHYSELTEWGAIFALPGTQFVNLQYDDCESELLEAEGAFGIQVHRWSDLDLKDDLEDVFALCGQLDLILSANTSVAEIGRALNTPTWKYSMTAPAPKTEAKGRSEVGWDWHRHVTESWDDLFVRIAEKISEECALPNGNQEMRPSKIA